MRIHGAHASADARCQGQHPPRGGNPAWRDQAFRVFDDIALARRGRVLDHRLERGADLGVGQLACGAVGHAAQSVAGRGDVRAGGTAGGQITDFDPDRLAAEIDGLQGAIRGFSLECCVKARASKTRASSDSNRHLRQGPASLAEFEEPP
jgi:hypothetical protein